MPDFVRDRILAEAHGGAMGGHYAGKVTMQKILCRSMVANTAQGFQGIL